MTRTYKKRKISDEKEQEQNQSQSSSIDEQETTAERQRLKFHWRELSKKLKEQLKSGDPKTIFHLAQLSPKSEYPINQNRVDVAKVKVEPRENFGEGSSVEVPWDNPLCTKLTLEEIMSRMAAAKAAKSVTSGTAPVVIGIAKKEQQVTTKKQATSLTENTITTHPKPVEAVITAVPGNESNNDILPQPKNYKSRLFLGKQYSGANHCIMCHENFDQNSSLVCTVKHEYVEIRNSQEDYDEDDEDKDRIIFSCTRCSCEKRVCTHTGKLLREEYEYCYRGCHIQTKKDVEGADTNGERYDLYDSNYDYPGCPLNFFDDYDRERWDRVYRLYYDR
jgi:hypothetical protein